MRLSTILSGIFFSGLLFQIGCGGSGGASVSSLSQLPDAASMVSTSTTSTSLTYAAVTGTAPLITDLKSKADQYFWNGLIAQIGDSGWAALDAEVKRNDAKNFWGTYVDANSPSGSGGCFMAQNTGQVFGRLLESAGSACYMKNMPNATSGVTVTPTPSGGASHLFDQQSGDTLVRVNISGMTGDDHGGAPEQVFIKVFGTGSVGSDVYKVQLYFCSSGSVNGAETFEVNKSTLSYTAASVHQEGEDGTGFSSSVAATLKSGSGGNLAFDPEHDRVITMKGSFGSDSFGAKITITSDNLIYSLMNHSNGSFSDRSSSVSEFSGTDANSVRFLAAGYVGSQSGTGFDHGWGGALEWQGDASTTGYYHSVAADSSDLYTKANSVDLTNDAFFQESRTPSLDFTEFVCNPSVDYTVSMDFTDSAVAAIQTECDGDHQVRGDDNNYCWSGTALQTAQTKVQNQCNTGGC